MAKRRRSGRGKGPRGPKGGRREPSIPLGHPDHPLEQYRELIDDWDAFLEAIQRPEPAILRTNTLRISPEALRERLEQAGYGVEAVAGQRELLHVVDESPGPVSDTLEHWLGLFYMQQAATSLAAGFLGARPGERVLDLCAAPGGKTTHLVEQMEGKGTVVCADVNENRIRALLGNVYRLGHRNVVVLAADARTFPTGPLFDRVMVDVPCSAQGTLRKRGGHLPHQRKGWEKQITKAQRKILERAIQLTRPGGTLLYVTCTFDPIENEGVLTRVLAEHPEIDVDPIELDLPHARGVTAFGKERYDERMAGAVRIYPHHLDSGGLFLCRLVKAGGGEERSDAGWSPVPSIFPGEELSEAEAEQDEADAERMIAEQFGVTFDDVGAQWLRRGTNLWMHEVPEWPVEAWEPGRWRVVATGLRSVDTAAAVPRPTSDLILALGDRISERVVELTVGEWSELLEAGEVASERPDGRVTLALEGTPIARGFVREGVVRHEVPKGRLRWLRAAVGGRDR